jgi:hypothetical protein
MNRDPRRAAIAATPVTTGLVAIHTASAHTTPRRIVNGWLPYWTMSESLNPPLRWQLRVLLHLEYGGHLCGPRHQPERHGYSATLKLYVS